MLPGGFLGRQMPGHVRRLLRRFYRRLEAMSWPLLMHFKQQHDTTLIAVHREKVNLNPAADLCVHGGDDLYLIARERLAPEEVAWDSVSACAGTAGGGASATGGGGD